MLPGDSLGELVVSTTRAQGITPDASSALIVAQKVVSKAEGRRVKLTDVDVTAEAQALADLTGKDPRLVSLILSESRSIIRTRPGLIIAEHHTGHILANAGIDGSNVGDAGGPDGETVLLWPEDPDASARGLARHLGEAFGMPVPVIISDSLGRPWRVGTVNAPQAMGMGAVPAILALSHPGRAAWAGASSWWGCPPWLGAGAATYFLRLRAKRPGGHDPILSL